MAARENQGLQIALIIFVMLTIVLIVSTYMFFRSFSDERDRAKSLESQKSTADTAARTALDESLALKSLIGVPEGENIAAVREAAEQEFQAHGEGIPDSNKSYQALVEHLVAKLRKFEQSNIELTAKVAELNGKLATNDDAAKAEVAKYTAELAKVVADLEQESQAFKKSRTEITGQKDLLAAGFQTTRKEHDALLQKSSTQISTLSDQLARADQLLNAMRNEKQLQQKGYEVADGRVTRVNQRTRLAWLNVGPADGLRRQTSFVVVAPEDGNPISAEPKAILEVVRMTDAHGAEARIVEDDLSNPIMPGDSIFSVAWDAGRAEHFALAGTMDIDNDGDSDRQRIRDLIALNGGVIDAEVADDGQRSGKMSIHTKYLVLGDRPELESENRESYGTILDEATRLGVKTLDIGEFLDYLGYKDDYRTVNLGRFAKPEDFKPRLPGGVQRILPGSTPARDLRKPRRATESAPN